MIKKIALIIFLLWSGWAITAISDTSLPPLILNGDKLIRFDEIPFATVRRETLWKQRTISVCWENPADGSLAMREMIRKAIEDTWQNVSNIKFIDWHPCQDESKGIRILISDERPHVKALGNVLNGRPNGMVLNFSLDIWGERCASNITFCIKALAVHEFGHALGFAHEQTRDDAPPECQTELEDPSLEGNWNLTGYDYASIMNYCNPHWLNQGLLSKRDIDAVKYVYPPETR